MFHPMMEDLENNLSQEGFNLLDQSQESQEKANSDNNDIQDINDIPHYNNYYEIEENNNINIRKIILEKDNNYINNWERIENDQRNFKLNCIKCEVSFTKCTICNGIFDINFFKNEHYLICQKLSLENRIMSSCVKCNVCKAFITIENFEEHAKICKEKSEMPLGKFECVLCKKLIDLFQIDEHEKICEQSLNKIYLMTTNVKCDYCCKDFPEINIQEHIENCAILNKEKQDLINKEKQLKIEFPNNWVLEFNSLPADTDKNKLKIVVDPEISYYSLDPTEVEYSHIVSLLREQMIDEQLIFGIKEIRRVQNKIIYKKFQLEKLKITEEKGYAKERTLFFYDQNIAIDYLVKNGFDISFADDNSEFGRGIYFYKEAKYALELINKSKVNNNNFNSVNNNAFPINNKGIARNSSKRLNLLNYFHPVDNSPILVNAAQKQSYLVISKVLTGMKFLQDSSNRGLKKPPYYNAEKTIMYDSIKNKNSNPDRKTTYVVYDNDKCYPEYIVEFL